MCPALLLSSILWPRIAQADLASDSPGTYYLGEVVVTAKRSPTTLFTNIREVTRETAAC